MCQVLDANACSGVGIIIRRASESAQSTLQELGEQLKTLTDTDIIEESFHEEQTPAPREPTRAQASSHVPLPFGIELPKFDGVDHPRAQARSVRVLVGDCIH